ncbi:hypothetical protein GCM10023212_06280 [Luteolibacter yonseiensis]
MFLIALIFAFRAPAGQGGEVEVAQRHSAFGAGESLATDKLEEEPSAVTAEPVLHRSIKYVGKYHLMVLHFPIAFLLAAMVVHWYALVTGRGSATVAVLLWFGTFGAIAAAALGWMYAYDSVYFGDDEQILLWHRWLGTGTAVVSVVVALARKRLGPKALAFALTICAGLVAAAAHFGASLVYGADFLKKF